MTSGMSAATVAMMTPPTPKPTMTVDEQQHEQQRAERDAERGQDDGRGAGPGARLLPQRLDWSWRGGRRQVTWHRHGETLCPAPDPSTDWPPLPASGRALAGVFDVGARPSSAEMHFMIAWLCRPESAVGGNVDTRPQRPRGGGWENAHYRRVS